MVSFHLIAFLMNEYFTPEWQRDVCDITHEVVAAMQAFFISSKLGNSRLFLSIH